MYAVLVTGGKQYRVMQGETLRVELLDVEAGKEITFDNVLMLGDGDGIKVGDALKGASVTAKVVGHGRADKVRMHYLVVDGKPVWHHAYEGDDPAGFDDISKSVRKSYDHLRNAHKADFDAGKATDLDCLVSQVPEGHARICPVVVGSGARWVIELLEDEGLA